MSTYLSPYVPVLCEFHDRLEAIASMRRSVDITFADDTGVVRQCLTTIADVYTRDGAEYLATGAGEIIRLDRIVAADGKHPLHG